MGHIKHLLTKTTLPEREKHRSRLFIDLAENVHIHHRDFRVVFHLDEFFEYVYAIYKSAKDIRNYLLQNPQYRERMTTDTIIIAGGKERQLKFLTNSPEPNMSYYFPNDFAIELQDESEIDEIHIHYRDFRLAIDRKEFKIIAKEFLRALEGLEAYEESNSYVRKKHPNREIENFNKNNKDNRFDAKIKGISKINLSDIYSYWYKDIANECNPDPLAIKQLQKQYEEEKCFAPILLSTEKNNSHFIIDGHHRYYVACKLGLKEIDAIICDFTFEESEELRKTHELLKKFDRRTNYKYNLSDFVKEYLSFKLNSYYRNSFAMLTRKQRFFCKLLLKIKYFLSRIIKSEKDHPF